ncbi:MAG: SUMF1/EgtB/PvdO family nonheme iron enzyme [Anaerolineaceae bacterium]|nr:SUMF1/EgtB/PvdO family nonheme iron enzyme [Anaerolineaceae bacterium]
MEQKTVFLSYRRTLSKHLARSIYLDLKMHDWDVFLDVNTIDSGDFDRIILNQIAARAHFILLISAGSLERCANPGDWVLREIQEAVRLGRNIVPVVEEGADFTREVAYLPTDIRAVISKKNALPLPHFFFDAAVDMLRTRFLKTPEYVAITAAPATDQAEVQRRLAEVETVSPPPASIVGTRPAVSAILPPPFAWVEIPGGQGTLKTDEKKVTLAVPTETYWIAKYPMTNAQYAKFIAAGGYAEKRWWTEAGWQWREKETWTEPRYWNDAQWNGAEYPVVGVSWYEAVAFCLWLSEAAGETILLPTEAQWQYAAQGVDGRLYPWGNEWDAGRCNTYESGIGKTTPVRQYEGKGDSPFGVVDMAGNAGEWCLTDYDNQTNDFNSNANMRVVRGGSWGSNDSIARAAARFGFNPLSWVNDQGFRVVCAAPI